MKYNVFIDGAEGTTGLKIHQYFQKREEKLSTEFYNYGKEEIKRINKKHGHGGHKKKEKEDDLAEIEGDLLKEIKELMKD